MHVGWNSKSRQHRASLRGVLQFGALVLLLTPLAMLSGCSGVVSASHTTPGPQQISAQLSPVSLAFGNIAFGQKTSLILSVTNTGQSNITLLNATSSATQFSISGVTLPLTLGAGQTATVNVWFNGTTSGAATGTLTLSFSEPAGGTSTATVPLTGNASTSKAQLSINPTSVNFGKVTTGTTGNSAVALTNTGGSDLTISVITVSGAAFGVSGITTPKTISAGQSAILTATYSPTAAGNDTGSISITSNDPASPSTITLSGTGSTTAVGQLTLNPASLNFGSVAVGANAILPATVTNSGQTAVQISGVTITGGGFSATGVASPSTLNAGQSATLQVKYAPTAPGAASGSISIASNAGGSPTVLTLTGTGAQAGLSASPAAVNFGSVIGGQTKSQSISLTNTGSSSLTVTQVKPSGTGFSVTGLTTPLIIAAGQSSSFMAQFAPQTAGNSSGSLSVVSNATNSPATIALSGTGTAASSTLTATPSNWNFGNVVMGATASQNVTITNTGNTTANLSQMTVSGTGYSASGVTTPATIAPSQSVTLSVRFTPTALGAVSGAVALVTTQGQTLNVTASGTGVQAGLSVTPASISFGSVSTGSSSSQTVQLKNTGTSTLTITQAAITGTGFSDTGLALPQSIAAGATANFNVQFAPQTASNATGTLTLTSNAPNSPSTLTLSGTGVASTQTLLISPTSLSFGSVTAGTSSSKTFTITNSGNSSVAISSITASGTGFAITAGGGAVSLTPTQSVTVTVQFSPATAAVDSGSVSVVSNAAGSPGTVTLSGTGVAVVQHSADLSWTASTSAVSGYNVYRGTVSGGSYSKINSSLVGGVSFNDSTVVSGTTYYYVTTSVDSSNNESTYSNEVQAIIP